MQIVDGPQAPLRISGPAAAIIVALCFAVAVLEGFDIQAMGVAAPRMAPELGLGPDQMGWVFAMANVGLAIGAAFGGWLADRVGRKPVFIGSVATFGVFTLATMVADTFPVLIAVRFATGLALGAALPNMVAIASEISTPRRRALITSLIFCGMPAGGAASALVAGLLPEGTDWRLLFLLGGLGPLVLIPAFWILLKETREMTQTRARPLSLPRVLFGEGRLASTLLAWAALFPTLLILYLLLNWLPTLAIAKGLTPAVASQTALWFNLGGAVGAVILAALADRFGWRWPLTLAFGGLVGAAFGLAAAVAPTTVLILGFLAGFCLLGAQYALYGIAAGYYPSAGRAAGAGLAISVGRLGSIAGPVLAGAMLGAGASVDEVLRIMIPIAAVAGLSTLALSFVRSRGDDAR